MRRPESLAQAIKKCPYIVHRPVHSCLDSQLAFSKQRLLPHRLSGTQRVHNNERVGTQPGLSRGTGRTEWGLNRSLVLNDEGFSQDSAGIR
eukprot:6129990-Alexandrium_andersonii.AAC.1